MEKTFKNYYEEMANELADMIEANTAPWQKEWEGGKAYLPFNIKSGKEYQGINIFNLMKKPYNDPRWLTYAQAHQLGATVRAGEKGTRVVYMQTTAIAKEKDERGKEKEVEVLLSKPKVYWSTVFNAEQCEGIKPLERDDIVKYQWDPLDKAQEVIDNSGVVIEHKNSSQAFYNPGTDKITLPLKEQFPKAENYYRTALHELGHATGHVSRLARHKNLPTHKEKAHEELVAELTSFMTGSFVGLGHKPSENTLSYLKSWSKNIRDDPKYLMTACQEADKATKYLIGDLKKELNNGRENITAEEIVKQYPTYINVPKEEKEEAKKLGARWDKNMKSWYVPSNIDITAFSTKWAVQEVIMSQENQKYFIGVPYRDKEEAKKLGARWDSLAQSWYCQPEDKDKFAKWSIENATNVKNDIAIDPKDEFYSQITGYGVLEKNVDLIGDGNKHRIAVEGDKLNEKSGFYVLHTDGVPNGYFMNNRTGETLKWLQKGYILSAEEKQQMKSIAHAKQAERQQISNALEEKSIANLRDFFSKAEKINTEESMYFKNKNIEASDNVFKAKYGEIAIPLINIDGELISAQYINDKGDKKFASNARRNAAFHIVNAKISDLACAKDVILAEGYSTAVTIAESFKNNTVPVIATMGASNIEKTVTQIQEKYPSINILLAVDNDKKLESKGIKNVGLDTANGVAKKYQNVTTVMPKCNNNEMAGDFNDLVSNFTSKEEAQKSIAKQFEKVFSKNKLNDRDKEKTIEAVR